MMPEPKAPDLGLVRALAHVLGLPLDDARIGAVQQILAGQLAAGLSLPPEELRGIEPATVLLVAWE